MNYALIILISTILIFISNQFGNKIAGIFKLSSNFQYTALGLSAILAILFLIYIPMVMFNASALIANNVFCVVILIITVFALYDLPKHLNYSLADIAIMVVYVVIMVLLSTRLAINEKLGDSNFYFTIVQRNIDSSILGQFKGYNGGIYSTNVIGIQYAYQSFYQLWSAILWIVDDLAGEIVINSAIYMWGCYIIYYFMMIEAILNAYKAFNSKSGLILSIAFIGLFVGSIYYNLALPHIGVIFLTAILTNEILIIYNCINTKNSRGAWIVGIFSAACISCASSGLFISFFISYAYLMLLAYNKKAYALKSIAIVAFPIMLYSVIFKRSLFFTIICIIIELLFIILPRLIEKNERLKSFMLSLMRWLIMIVPLALILTSLFLSTDYGDSIKFFFKNFGDYERVQNYFSFASLTVSIKNLLYYLMLSAIFINKKTRKFSFLLLVIIITFANPFVVPFIIKFFTKEEVYHRIFYVLFSNGFLIIGIFALTDLLSRVKWIKLGALISILALSLCFFYQDMTSISYLYTPSQNNNILYKLDQDQVDAVTKLRDIIEAEDLKYPKVISQIYGTIIIAPKITLINGVLERRDYKAAYKNDDVLKELIEIFYTPLFPGDDGDRLTADYQSVNYFIAKAGIEFIIVDRSLYVTNENDEWMPLYTFLDESAHEIYSNDSYIIYRISD